MKSKTNLKDIWFRVFLLAFFSLLYIISSPYPQKSKQFPHLIAIFSLIVVTISFLIDLSKKGKSKEEIPEEGDRDLELLIKRSERRKRFYKAWGIILISISLGFFGGFIFTALFLFLGFSIFFGRKKNLLKNVVISLSITLIIFFIFQWIFGSPLLMGFIW